MPKIEKTEDGLDYTPIIFDKVGRIVPLFQSLAEVTNHVLTYGGAVSIPVDVLRAEQCFYLEHVAPLIEESRRVSRAAQIKFDGIMVK